MKLKIPEDLVRAIGEEEISRLSGGQYIREEWSFYADHIPIDLDSVSVKRAEEIRTTIEKHSDIRGAKVVLRDIDIWLKSRSDPSAVKPRKLEHFESLLIDFLLAVDGHRLFYLKNGRWHCAVVTEVEYHPKVERSDYTEPAYVDLDYVYDKLGSRCKTTVGWHAGDVSGRTVREALADNGLFPETPELRAQYLAEAQRYREVFPQVGRQFIAHGTGYDEISKDRWAWHRSTDNVVYTEGERPNRVVIDILTEPGEDRDRSEGRGDSGLWFWRNQAVNKRLHLPLGVGEELERQIRVESERREREEAEKKKRKKERKYSSEERETLDVEDIDDEGGEGPPAVEVPVHPYVVVFDLLRHQRLSIHVSDLTEYVYDRNLSEKLVLPVDIKGLVRLLVEHREGKFRDIVAGKSGGAIVLLTGPPGVGKTLTAEVFSEAEQRPLYSVQASQLGTDPDELEKNLMRILARAERWKAIMLLDEADVYVHERGNDLAQNAIIGVFLRVLEYYSSVLFLTTNRPDLVDDAIASRCIARIDYAYPTPEEQTRIWSVLSGTSGVVVDPKEVETFVRAHPNISGRDVKNLLKLAELVSSATREPITAKAIEYALRFKPTVSLGETERYRSVNGAPPLPPVTPVAPLPDGTAPSLEAVKSLPDERLDAYVRSTARPRPSEAAKVLLGAPIRPAPNRALYLTFRRRLNSAIQRARR